MHKKIMGSLVMLSMISVILSGCQLAVAEAGNTREEDKLVGVFVTEDYIDLFDFEAFASENSNKLIQGEEVLMDSKHEGRVYGTINENNPGDVVFEDYEGVLFIDASYEKDGESYSRVGSSNQVSLVHISVKDNGKSIEGTIFAKNAPVILAVLNPVYKTDEGEIYFTSGSGISMGNEDGGGGSMSMFLSEERTSRVGNSESTESFEVKINVEGIDEVDHYVLKQMDEHDNQIIAEKIYAHDVPSNIEVGDQAQYMILEKIGVDYEGKPLVERQIVNDDYFQVYFFNESAFVEGYSIQLNN
ncbi:hypothetical protein [Petrocella sp. FN5]|uniref:hypothetical protein n=1 Tax=Petrocella sp. FN5 TaxID=3032002 RepID=UPI0023DA6E75|nr:hypothetical protein [Petrocella sp. FN5]MDF1618040.1 hypothetical protein [Petrocella sp. FN5]